MSVVPELHTFRKAVEAIPDPRDRTLIQALYLCAARVSELTTKVGRWELEHKKTKPYGRFLEPRIEEFNGEKVLLLKSAIAKRKTKSKRLRQQKQIRLVFKLIALPCSMEYEPWTVKLLEHIRDHKNINFSLTRSTVYKIVRKRLSSLDEHIHTHSLRHYRLTHLVEYYGFDSYDLTLFAGWTFQTGVRSSAPLDTYLHLDWRKYFPKLLKPLAKI